MDFDPEALHPVDDVDLFPSSQSHRGVRLHDFQSDERLALVRQQIDRVFELNDEVRELARMARSVKYSPEARVAAASRALAIIELRAERREGVPAGLDVDLLRSYVTGLNGRKWVHPALYCLGDDPDRDNATPREQPLPPTEAQRRLDAILDTMRSRDHWVD